MDYRSRQSGSIPSAPTFVGNKSDTDDVTVATRDDFLVPNSLYGGGSRIEAEVAGR